MALIRYWCKLKDDRDCSYQSLDLEADMFITTVLDTSRTPIERIHGYHPAIIDWYGDEDTFPPHLRYMRDTEPPTYENFTTLKEYIEEYRKAKEIVSTLAS